MQGAPITVTITKIWKNVLEVTMADSRLVNSLAFILITLSSFFVFVDKAHAEDRYFGYWANTGKISENYQHANITHIWTGGYPTLESNTQAILDELAIAKSLNIKAMVHVIPYVFDISDDEDTNCPLSLSENSVTQWADFVETIIQEGYLVPGNPEASTVASFYPVDEPEFCGLKDQNGAPHPALQNAIDTIRSHSDTASIPIAVITTKWKDVRQALALYDWAGNIRYDKSTGGFLSAFDEFSESLSSGQRTILMPQASFGGSMMGSFGDYHDPDPVIDRFLEDQKVVMVMPFLWDHPQTTGVSGIQELREAYIDFGDFVKTGAPLDLIADVSCAHEGGGSFYCIADAGRGTPGYTFDWQNAAWSSGNHANYVVNCGIVKTAMVTVIDSAGDQDSASETLSCSGGTVIQ